jgi:hypothetical protein
LPDSLPEHFGLFVLAGGALLAVALVVVGLIRLVRSALVLKKRVFGYAELPLLTELRGFEERMALADAAVAQVPVLEARYERALAELAAARDRIVAETGSLVSAFRQCYRI